MVVLIDAAFANHRVLLDLLELVAHFLALQVRAATLAATHRQLVARNPSLAIEAAPERNLPLHASKLLAPVVLHHGEEFRWFESAGHLFFLLRFQRITEARIISNNSLSLSPRHCGNSLSTKITVASSLLLAGDLAERSRTLRPILHPGARGILKSLIVFRGNNGRNLCFKRCYSRFELRHPLLYRLRCRRLFPRHYSVNVRGCVC